MSENREGLFIPQRAWLKLRELIIPTYAEVYQTEFPHDVIPLKKNYKNGQLMGSALLAERLFPKRYLDDESDRDNWMPPFANGRCETIGGGDYKTVVADDDGKSDMVIRIYRSHHYRGPDAKEKAEAAAAKIEAINEIARRVAPGFILPSTVIVAQTKGGNFQVFEKQQRAFPLQIDIFDPKTADRLHQQAVNVQVNGTKRVEQELLKRGLSRKEDYHGITDDFKFTDFSWDLITQHLVSLDFIDKVDIAR